MTASLVPVDHDPFAQADAAPAAGPALVPVDHDPFAPQSAIPDAPDALKQLSGAIYKGVGSTVRGVGAVPQLIGEYVTTPIVNKVLGTNYKTGNLLDPAADAISGVGEGLQSRVAPATREAIQQSAPQGSILQPSTWSFGEKPSATGYLYLGLDVMGQMFPAMAASIATSGLGPMASAVSAGAAGGAQGGGGAIEEARKIIDDMAAKGTIAQESAYYRKLIDEGRPPAEALAETRRAAERLAFLLTTPVSAMGGTATGALINPATKIVSGANLPARAAARGAIGAGEEGIQEVTESVQTKQGVNLGADAKLDPFEGTFADFVLGALGGGPPGAIAGMASPRTGARSPAAVQPSADDPFAEQPQGVTPASQIPQQNQSAPAPVVTQGTPDDAALLRGYGYTPEQIALMSPEMLATEAEAARQQGVVPMAAPAAAAPSQSAAARPETVPESVDTLIEQQRQLVDGRRAVQMYPKGTPELYLPENAVRVVAPSGDVFHFNPDLIELPEVLEASGQGRENDILGLGPYSKADLAPRVAAGEQPVAVVERTPQGTEVRAAAGTDRTAPAQAAAMEPDVEPGNSLDLEQPEETIAARAQSPVESGDLIPGTGQPSPAAPAAQPSGPIAFLTPDQINVDAKRFQFKGGSDEKGVTGALGGVPKWDDRLANPILAWQARDGKVYVANGHQRTDLAKRAQASGQQGIQIPARIMREEDGFTPEYMKTLGAFQNIAEGTGSATDAARVLRTPAIADMGMPDLPPRSQLVQQAEALAKLSDDAFGMVANGIVPEAYAAQVGRALKDPKEQMAAMALLVEHPPETAEQARIMIEDVKNSGFLESETSDMFGSEEFKQSLVPERAKVLDRALQTLRKTRTVFKTAVEQESTLADAGNVLDRDTNIKAKTDHERLAEVLRANGTRKGPISDELTIAARELAGGKKLPAVVSQFLGRVRQLTARPDQEGVQSRAPADSNGPAREESRPLFQRPRRHGALRSRVASALRQRDERLRAKGLPSEDDGEVGPLFRREGGERTISEESEPLFQTASGVGVYGAPTKQYLDNEVKIAKAVEAVAKDIMPGADVAGYNRLWVADRAQKDARTVTGAYWKDGPHHVVAWSLESPDAVGTVRHEAVHYLRNTGLLTDKEWSTLSRAVERDGWAERYDIAERYGDLPQDVQVEEAVAERFADWRRDRASRLPEGVRAIFLKMDLLLKRIAAAARRILGKDATADDIFTRMETGEVGRRSSEGAKSDRTAMQVPSRQQPNLPLHPSISIPNEIIADKLEARSMTKLGKVAKASGLARFNVTEKRVKLQDKFIRWKAIQESVEKATGRKLPEWMNTYQAESLYYGRTGQRLEKLDETHIDPLVKDIKARGLTLEGVDEFLMARHAPERNREIRKINKDIADPSGMSDAEAKAILDKIDASGKRADYDAVEKRVRDLVDETQQTMLKGGLISAEQLHAWRAKYKNYVPLRGFAEGEESNEAGGYGIGKGFDIRRGPEDKRALGRSSLADSPLGYVLTAAQQAVVRAEKNKVALTALRFVQNNPDPELWEVDKGDTKRIPDPKTGLVVTVGDPTYVNKPNVFAVKIDGVPHYINFKGTYGANLARALNSMGTANMGPVLSGIATMTRVMARLATSYNPEFMAANFIRDAGEAMINLQEQKQKDFVKKFRRHLIPAIGGSFNALAGLDGGKYARAFRELDAAGGRIRFFGMENAEDVKKNITGKLKRLEGGVVNNIKDAGKKMLDAIEIANGSIENATRLAAFMAAIDVGLPPAKAASIARELTVNFNRKGEYGSVISGLYMFANAAMQGQARMLLAMKNPRVRKFAYGLAAMGAAMAAYNIGAGGDDDDGKPYYLKLPPWERDTNFIMMWPKGFGRDGKTLFKIPMPYGYSFWHTIGARMSSMVYGKEKASKATEAMVKSVLDAFDPLGRDENWIAQFTPTIGKPLIHIGTNVNWTGKKITPDPMPWNKNEPDAYRHYRNASEFSVGAADKLNRLTGGTRRESGYIDVTPGELDYMIGFVASGIGRFAKNTFDTGYRAYQGQEWQPSKTPFVRRFYGEVDRRADHQLYYEAKDEVQKAKWIADGYRKDGDTANLQRIAKEYGPELSAYKKFFDRQGGSEAQLKKRRQEMDRIKKDKTLTEKERETRLKVEERREDKIIAEARKLLESNRANRVKASDDQ